MPLCPQCSAEVSVSERKCPSCGTELHLTSDPTAVQDADHTPTRLKKTKAEDRVHTTASGSGARFVAGHVLAGRYRIIGLIGRGGMGEVYKAEDLELDQTVALKFLPKELSKEEDLLKRFRSEVRTARQVSHPNVCRVFDIGETEGLYYITMEFIEGDDLSMLLQRIGRLPSDKAVEISRQICLGLGAIHKAGILHRDLKPSNIIIDQKGEARITDFGIAGIEAEVQGEEARVGTPAYMSPEQITGKEVTKRSDIYSLGLLLYEIFTGKQAFEGSSVQELREKHTKETPTNPSQIVTGIDPVVEDLIERCLKKDPQERPDSALKAAMMLPGGNPLQVALEAGETPTPEMVAAAPEKGVLQPKIAIALLIFFVISFVGLSYLASKYSDLGWAPLEKSHDLLVQDARNIVESFGYGTDDTGSASGYARTNIYDRYISATGASDSLEKLSTGQPYVYYFWYRQSPWRIIPWFFPRVEQNEPPRLRPEQVFVRLDKKGRLLEFEAIPPERTKDLSTIKEIDWKKVFEAAGLDLEKFRESNSEVTPPNAYDERKAWEGSLADHPEISIRIEAAAFQGKLVNFDINYLWEEQREEIQRSFTAFWFRAVIQSGIGLILIFGTLFLTFRNLRSGRADPIGAGKTAALVFIGVTASAYLAANHFDVPLLEIDVLFRCISFGAQAGMLYLITYLAIEPYVRRWWPENLISWNRLLAGQWKSPIIGRELLIGACLGTISTSLYFLSGFLRDYLQGKDLTRLDSPELDTLMGSRFLLSDLVRNSIESIGTAFQIFALLLLAYLILRKKWLAIPAFALLSAVEESASNFSTRGVLPAIVILVVFTLIYFAYSRLGVIAVATSFLIQALFYFPITFDPSLMYFGQSLFILALGIGLVSYGFYNSLGNQKLFNEKSMDRPPG